MKRRIARKFSRCGRGRPELARAPAVPAAWTLTRCPPPSQAMACPCFPDGIDGIDGTIGDAPPDPSPGSRACTGHQPHLEPPASRHPVNPVNPVQNAVHPAVSTQAPGELHAQPSEPDDQSAAPPRPRRRQHRAGWAVIRTLHQRPTAGPATGVHSSLETVHGCTVHQRDRAGDGATSWLADDREDDARGGDRRAG